MNLSGRFILAPAYPDPYSIVMNRATLSILDYAMATTTYGSLERVEAVEAVVYSAMFACNDDVMAYLWQAVYGLTDLEFRGALAARLLKLAAEIRQYQADAS